MSDDMRLVLAQRKSTCGDLWPPDDLDSLSSLELFERMRVCNRNKSIAFDNAGGTIREDQRRKDMQDWSAWGNAEAIYISALLPRLAKMP